MAFLKFTLKYAVTAIGNYTTVVTSQVLASCSQLHIVIIHLYMLYETTATYVPCPQLYHLVQQHLQSSRKQKTP